MDIRRAGLRKHICTDTSFVQQSSSRCTGAGLLDSSFGTSRTTEILQRASTISASPSHANRTRSSPATLEPSLSITNPKQRFPELELNTTTPSHARRPLRCPDRLHPLHSHPRIQPSHSIFPLQQTYTANSHVNSPTHGSHPLSPWHHNLLH